MHGIRVGAGPSSRQREGSSRLPRDAHLCSGRWTGTSRCPAGRRRPPRTASWRPGTQTQSARPWAAPVEWVSGTEERPSEMAGGGHARQQRQHSARTHTHLCQAAQARDVALPLAGHCAEFGGELEEHGPQVRAQALALGLPTHRVVHAWEWRVQRSGHLGQAAPGAGRRTGIGRGWRGDCRDSQRRLAQKRSQDSRNAASMFSFFLWL